MRAARAEFYVNLYRLCVFFAEVNKIGRASDNVCWGCWSHNPDGDGWRCEQFASVVLMLKFLNWYRGFLSSSWWFTHSHCLLLRVLFTEYLKLIPKWRSFYHHWVFATVFCPETIKANVMTVEWWNCIYFSLILFLYHLSIKQCYFCWMLTDSHKQEIF